MPVVTACLLLLVVACGPSSREDDSDDDSPGQVDAGPDTDAAVVALAGTIYAHDPTYLYTMNPDTFEVHTVGPFTFPDGFDQMTDMAVTADGQLYGVSFNSLYKVDPLTAVCTRLSNLTDSFNGLSFLPVGVLDPSEEVLVGTSQYGDLYRINLQTGNAVIIGSFGNGLTSSGDVVSVEGYGTVAAVNHSDGTVWLATIEPTTGAATLLYSTGLDSIWGLAFWKGKLYGFSPNGQVSQLDPAAQTTTLLSTETVPWWGAAVTTSAPVIP